MELNLDRRLVDKRLFPAIDIEKSGTRREELLIPADDLSKLWLLRKAMSSMNVVEVMELLIDRIKKTKTNKEFLESMAKG